MIFDRTLLFSNAQAITASAASTDIVDLGATGTVYGAASALIRDIGKGQDIPLDIKIVEGFNNLTSLGITVQTDDNAGFSSPKDVISTTIPLARLGAGATSPILNVPAGTNERYVRIYYTVTGTAPTLGRVTAGVVMGNQTAGVTF